MASFKPLGRLATMLAGQRTCINKVIGRPIRTNQYGILINQSNLFFKHSVSSYSTESSPKRSLNELETEVESLLRKELAPTPICEVVDRFGDGKLLEITISSPSLLNKPMVRQHQTVFKTISPFSTRYHAVQVKVVDENGEPLD